VIPYLIGKLRTPQIEQMLDTIPNTTHKAIFNDDLLPESYQSLSKFILVYRVSPKTPDDIQTVTYRVSCRQTLKSDAEALADLVYEQLNRTFGNNGKPIYSQCRIQQAIPEEENLYHVPVDIEVKNA
jgi:hypothetical protein